MKSIKNISELIDIYVCKVRKKDIPKRCSMDINKGSSNRKKADINDALTVGTYVTGILFQRIVS